MVVKLLRLSTSPNVTIAHASQIIQLDDWRLLRVFTGLYYVYLPC
jgi:hypothetical protein